MKFAKFKLNLLKKIATLTGHGNQGKIIPDLLEIYEYCITNVTCKHMVISLKRILKILTALYCDNNKCQLLTTIAII